jgi:4a-hydroxytetrahydrobiopterin dehydratase
MGPAQPVVIDRTTAEARLRALLRSGFGPGLPRREADRFILLHAIAGTFGEDEAPGEREVTGRLAAWLARHGARLETDPVTLRRALIDDGFLVRDDRGQAYRRSRDFEKRVVFDFADAPAGGADPADPPSPPTPAGGLAGERCVACHAGAPRVGDDEARALAAEIPGWSIEVVAGVPRLTRSFAFPDFASALAFANRVGAVAEAADHHPELRVEWGRVTVGWWTHAIGGLHRNDFILAARTDRLAGPGTGSEAGPAA